MREEPRPQSDHLTPSIYTELIHNTRFILGEWREEAECLAQTELDPMSWFPAERAYVPEKVKEICDRCPVRIECLSWAIYTRETEGIWGGRSPRSVANITRRMRQILRRK